MRTAPPRVLPDVYDRQQEASKAFKCFVTNTFSNTPTFGGVEYQWGIDWNQIILNGGEHQILLEWDFNSQASSLSLRVGSLRFPETEQGIVLDDLQEKIETYVRSFFETAA